MQRKQLSNDDIGILFFLAALVFGIWFRLFPPLTTGFPINDGALFYKMIVTLQENSFRLPAYVDYNELQIPFAYPPLAFYLAGSIGAVFHIPVIKIVLWMPAIVLCLTLPCVFWLTKCLLKSTYQAGITVFLYALLPRSLTWMIMGGGVTRSLGNLFLILATLYIYMLFTKKQTIFIYGAIIFSSAVCLTHPEAAIHTIVAALILWRIYGRDKTGFRDGVVVGIGTLIVTSPWWLTVLQRFGLEPFLAASRTGLYESYSGFYIFNDFSEEPFMTIIAVLAVLGIFIQLAKRQYFLPAWYFIPFLVEPRNAPNVSILPMAILGAISLTELIVPGFARFESSHRELETASFPQSRTGKFFIAYLVVALLFGMLGFEIELNMKHLSKGSQAAFQWVKTNTSKDKEFLVITGDTGLFSDYVNEWFPLLAERHSHTTIQGNEWNEENNFSEKSHLLASLQYCVMDEKPRICIESLADRYNLAYDYVLVQQNSGFAGNLTSDLLLSESYKPVYNAQSVIIFERYK